MAVFLPMSVFTPGLVSVSFRSLAPAEIVALSVRAGVEALEWGGDIHVPPHNVSQARAVGTLTCESGLTVAAYGSYYHVGDPAQSADWEPCVETAVALGAPVIRVWAGNSGSSETDESTWSRVAEDLHRITVLAADAGITVATEFHGDTLCDTVQTTLQVLAGSGSPAPRTLWQPLGDASPAQRAAEIRAVLSHLAHVHVFHWPQGKRATLQEGESEWTAVMQVLRDADRSVPLLLEFVREDDPEQFVKDAATLLRWIEAPT